MDSFALLALAVALAVDAFAVAAATAVSLDGVTGRQLFRLSFHFGLFQSLMLLAGWAFGSGASALFSSAHHWIAFALLLFVGGRMIWGAFRADPGAVPADRTRGWDLVLLSIATSIDALAVGVSLALVDARIGTAAVVIGAVAAGLTVVGMMLGRRIGLFWGRRVEALGGTVLVVIALKIILEHLSA